MQAVQPFNGFESIYDYGVLDSSILVESGRIFSTYRDKGVFVSCQMSDDVWQATDEKHTVTFRFDLDRHLYEQYGFSWTDCPYETFKSAVKSYTLLNTGRFVLDTLVRNVNVLNSLVISPLEGLEIAPVCYSMVMDFLAFLPGKTPEKEALMERLDNPGPRIVSQSRTLAPLSAYIRFEEAMNDFWKVAALEEKIHFFPVRLWWIVTMILPLRVTEFLLTPRDCLSVNNGQTFLTVRRTRLKAGTRRVYYTIQEDYETFTYPIPAGIAEEIRQYIDNTAAMPQSELDTLFIPEDSGSYLSYPAMCFLLRDLLEQWEITEHIRLGDTRHLSMISLILSGDTPSICKALADHANILVSMGYYANIKTLSGCQIIRFLFENSPATVIPQDKPAALIPAGSMLRVKDGYCDCQSLESFDARECCKCWSLENGLGDCRVCCHFHPDNSRVTIDLKARLREEMAEDYAFLIESVELLRKGMGKPETIEQIVKRLRSTVLNYIHLERNSKEHGHETA